MAGMAALLEASELSGERASVRLLEGMEATWDDVLETDGTLQLQRLLAADRRAARARAATAATLAAHDVKRGMVRGWRGWRVWLFESIQSVNRVGRSFVGLDVFKS